MYAISNIRSKINNLNEEAYSHIDDDIALVKSLAEEALGLCETLTEPYELGYLRAQAMQLEWLIQQGQMLTVIEIGASLKTSYSDFPPDKWLVAALYSLGVAFHHTGQIALALATHQEQLAFARDLGIRADEASALRRIGVAHNSQGQNELALKYYQQSADIYTAINNQGGVAGNLINSAIIYMHEGKFNQALDYAQRALDVFTQMAHTSGQVVAHTNLAKIYLGLENIGLAEEYGQQALKFARQTARPSRIIGALNASAKIANYKEAYEEALTYLLEAETLAKEAIDVALQASCLEILSETYEKMGDIASALVAHQQFHVLKIQLLEDAGQMRYESLEVLHQTREAQQEAENQRQLREEERNYYKQITQMKDELLSTASHDLKNPLGTIMLMSSLLRSHLAETDDNALRYLSNIDSSALQMRELIINLLDLARLESRVSLEMGANNIVTLIEEVCADVEERIGEKGLSLTCQLEQPSLILHFDRTRVRQVLLNLLSNAIKYTPAPGEVHISVKHEADNLLVQIQDTGIGIPADDLPNIFNRFYRVQNETHQRIEGTGLGLAICQVIIEQHHGKIWAESELGAGSLFSFTMPFNHSSHKLMTNH